MTQVSEIEYREATYNYVGFCPDCAEFTRDGTEPDAEGYDCPSCGGSNVLGAEQAMIMGMLDIGE